MKTRKSPIGWLKCSSPTILICVSAIGVVATAVMAAKAAPKAKQLLEEAKKENGAELSKKETVKVAAPVYIPAMVSGALTITCMFCANTLSRRTQASLVSAYALLDNSYKHYKQKVKELFGEEAHQRVIEEIAKEDCKEVPITAGTLVGDSSLDFGVREEKRLFYDMFSERYFESTIGRVLQAEYHLNRNYVLGGCCTLNEFYEFLGLAPMKDVDALGWDYESGIYWIDFNHSNAVLDDGQECCIIEMVFDPCPENDFIPA